MSKKGDSEESISLFHIAKFISREINLKNALETSGANKAKLLEKYEKNEKSIRNQTLVTKIVLSVYFGILAIIPLYLFFQISGLYNQNAISTDAVLLSFSLIFAIYFGIQFVYFLIIGMPVIGIMMEGGSFRYLETLPISEERLRKLAFFTIFKNYDAPFIVMFLAFPVLMFILSLNPVILLVCLGVSFMNVLITFSLLVLAGEKMQRLMKKFEEGSKKATFFRLLTMLSYIFASFTVVFLIQWVLSSLGTLTIFFANLESSALLNYLFSLIPYPFAPGYLLSNFFLNIEYSPVLIITTSIGIFLFILATVKVTLSTIESLKSITSEETLTSIQKVSKEKVIPPKRIEMETNSPIMAFIKKDLSIASKDLQTLMFFIIPIVIPLVSFLSGMGAAMDIQSTSAEYLLIPWSSFFFLSIFNGYLLITGFLNIEQSGSAVLASLPIRERNRAKAKLFLMYPVQIIGYLLPSLLMVQSPLLLPFIMLLLCSLPAVLGVTLLVFELKVLLFGKLRFKYVLDEVNKSGKTLKWIILILSGGGLGTMVIVWGNIASIFIGFIPAVITILFIGLALLSILIYAFNRMFPKIE